nr:ABC transporter ATP-binding protein [Kibdelosporangium sp. MJ126-NF4]CEL21360.1 ABC-type multidrug transport system, ATPase component [Kibdelosporangium sp. MJ126-NF4]CTQ96073.1 ABC-type multidrug transport system, ATPase component [Kibdelosporangium sp. MJ126-NF4]
MAVMTTGLVRHFRLKKTTVEAVRGVDLDIGDGELVALLGPNGAGKSTLFRMLTTLLPPTAGTATVAGRDITHDPDGVRARIGYVGQKHSAGDNFRVRDELVTQGRSHGMTRADATRRADEVLDLLDLTPLAKRTPNTLSGGQRRRVDIAMGLVHRPSLLFLDEPSTGLDPHSRADVWEQILRLRDELAMTLVLSTHYLEEADRMAERVVIIDHGRIIADGTADRLRGDLAGDRIVLTLDNPADAARIAGVVEVRGRTVHISVPDAAAALPQQLRALDQSGVKVVAAQALQPTLDDVFLALTGRSIREQEAA